MISLNKKRHPVEPYKIYKARRAMKDKALKNYLRGRLIWHAVTVYRDPTVKGGLRKKSVLGTYRKADQLNKVIGC